MTDVRTTAIQTGIRQRSIRKHCRVGRATELVFILATGVMLTVGGAAEAQFADWDAGNPTADGAITGGVGDWDTGTANWTLDGGVSNTQFANGANARFGAPGGYVVTLTENITVNDIELTATGITIASATSETLTVSSEVDVSTGNTATISANVASDLINNSAGDLDVSGDVTGAVSNTGAGQLTLSGTSYGALTNSTGTTIVGSGTVASLKQFS